MKTKKELPRFCTRQAMAVVVSDVSLFIEQSCDEKEWSTEGRRKYLLYEPVVYCSLDGPWDCLHRPSRCQCMQRCFWEQLAHSFVIG
jgi:hypothetical protein